MTEPERLIEGQLEYDRCGSEGRSRRYPSLGSSSPPVAPLHLSEPQPEKNISPRRIRDIVGRRKAPSVSSEPPASTSGAALLARASEPDRLHFRTLVMMEGAFGPEHDYGLLIAPACSLVERQLNDRLVEPARAVGADLVALLALLGAASKDDAKRAAALTDWVERRKPAMLGTMSMVLQALRRGLERGHSAVGQFLGDLYVADFVEQIRSNRLSLSLDRFRERYRNPACHGVHPFDSQGYRAFSRLSFGNARLADWESQGLSAGNDPDDVPILHRLLECERSPMPTRPPEPSAAESLIGLVRPGGGTLGVRLEPKVVPPRGFHLGDIVCFRVVADEAVWLTLFDIGTSGAVTLLLPNADAPTVRLEPGGPLVFPDQTNADIDLELTGLEGVERLVAVVTRAQPARWAGLGNPFLRPDAEDLRGFASRIDGVDPAGWGASMICLDIGSAPRSE